MFYVYGSGIGIDEVDPVIAADRLGDGLDLDTISSGVTIAFALELFEMALQPKTLSRLSLFSS